LPRRDLRLYLQDILDSIAKIEDYTGGVSEVEFLQNTQIQDATIRRLAIMGEAVKHLPKRLRDHYPEVPWRQIAGARDVLIHDYAGVTMQDIWKVIQEDLPGLQSNVRRILEESAGEDSIAER
jgi:uncharacterized protein with HEPN domain